jgi:hypothetical protein
MARLVPHLTRPFLQSGCCLLDEFKRLNQCGNRHRFKNLNDE